MAANTKVSVAVFLVVVLAIGIVVALLFVNNPLGSKTFGSLPQSEAARNFLPMEEYTRFFQQSELAVNNRTYTYFWYEPEQPWPPGVKFPLVMVLHGAPGRSYAAKFLISGQMPYNYPAFVFVPVINKHRYWALPAQPGQGGGTLDPRHALPDMVRMIETLATHYPVDLSRIYVIGCSDGGTGVYGAVRHYPDFFAGAVAQSGIWGPEDGVHMTEVPLWIFHGRLDTVIPVEPARALAEIIKSRGGNVRYSEFDTMGHNCPSAYLYPDAMWKWLFSQRRS